ncbi:hypothetical protein [Rhizobium leguminosarum]|uniref:hypothetical protein n=1 Tax=Rhizobium leguminosarum TaxID=384 RepID=UPI000B92D536|nr:hypothetical protein [Rhizobium leguminosarum]ASS56427.1 hypothetical protein CHR56_18715 [Rhizobium leguminosarum bv. viciae]
MSNTKRQLEDILIELMDQNELGDDDIVAAVERYPEHRDAILLFYEDWLTADDGRSGTEEPSGYVPDISGLWKAQAATEVANPFENLSPGDLRMVAQRCELSLSLLSSLEERAIRASTIPLLLVHNLAAEVKTTVAAMLQFFDQDQATMASDFRSDRAPVQKDKVSFADAIRSAPLSEELKNKWLNLSE